MNINDERHYSSVTQLDIGRLREDVEPFQSELMEEFYQNYAGLKDDMSTAAIYDKFAHLFSEDALGIIQGAMEKLEGTDDSRWLRYLRTFSTMGYMDSAVKALTDKTNTFEAKSVVDFRGERIPYRFVPVKLRNEPNTESRRELFEAKLAQTDELNLILHERMATAHDLSVVLGFKSYRDLCQTLKGVDYKALEEQMQEMLRRTENLYNEVMEELLERRIGAPISEAWSYDIPYAFRGEEYDRFFDKDKLVGAFNATLRGLGLDPEGTRNIHMDLEDRPKKTPGRSAHL